MSKLKIILQIGQWPSNRDVAIDKELPESIIIDAIQPLDLFKEGSPTVSRIFCSDVVTVCKVRMERKRLAKMISEEMAEGLIKAMEANDTLMGYNNKGY